jgi:hypothetical protein
VRSPRLAALQVLLRSCPLRLRVPALPAVKQGVQEQRIHQCVDCGLQRCKCSCGVADDNRGCLHYLQVFSSGSTHSANTDACAAKRQQPQQLAEKLDAK